MYNVKYNQRGPKTLLAHHSLVCNQGLSPDKPSFCEEDVCHWDLTLFGFLGKQTNTNLSLRWIVLLPKTLTIFGWSERTQVAPKLIISVKEMRKLLGSDGNSMSDDQIELLILTLTESSSMLLNQITVPKM